MSVELLADGAVLSVDAVLEESHSLSSQATNFPVEDGSNISDHIFNEPEQVTVTGIVSNMPVAAEPTQRVVLDDGTAVQAAQPPPGFATAAQDAYRALKALRESRRAVTLISNLDRYESMALTQLTIPRNSQFGQPADGKGGALRFTAEFKRIITVATQASPVPERAQAGTARDQAAGSSNQGTQATTTEQEETILHGIIGDSAQDARAFVRGLFTGGGP